MSTADPVAREGPVDASRIGALDAALAGLVSAGVALGTGELVSGAADRVPSLVVSVADVVVDDAPGTLVRWTISTFGTSQKTLLVTGVVVVALLVGAALGAAARRRLAVGAGGFVAFGVLGGWAAARQPDASDAGSWLTAAIAAGAGVATLALLLALARSGVSLRPPQRSTGQVGGFPLGRRWFLAGVGSAAGLGLLGAGIGRRLRQSAAVEAARADLARQLGSAPPTIPLGVPSFDRSVPGISPIVTPNADFYRIDAALMAPQVEPDGWTLRVGGMVDRPFEVTFDELLAMDRIEEFITLSCVSNEIGGSLVGNALWTGVPLADLLDRAGVQPGASQVVGRSVDGWTAGFPTGIAVDGRPAMVAITMNGEPLPVRHGFPARLVVPGLYGYVSATKWLREIELTTWEAFDGYWIPRGWAKEGPVKTQSRIDVPRDGARVAPGPVAVAGVAWAPSRRIDRVEVRVDDDAWVDARLSGALSDNAWVQWVHEWDATEGRHRIEVRATDGTGETQTEERSRPAPDGATGHHTIDVAVG